MKIALKSCKPIGNFVLVKIDSALERRAGSLALPDGVELENTTGARIGKVVDMGDLAQENEVKTRGPEVKVGDRVLFLGRGLALNVQGDDHELMPGAQVIAVVVPEADDNLMPVSTGPRLVTGI